MSGDKKFMCSDRDGNRFLLRISALDEYDKN